MNNKKGGGNGGELWGSLGWERGVGGKGRKLLE